MLNFITNLFRTKFLEVITKVKLSDITNNTEKALNKALQKKDKLDKESTNKTKTEKKTRKKKKQIKKTYKMQSDIKINRTSRTKRKTARANY